MKKLLFKKMISSLIFATALSTGGVAWSANGYVSKAERNTIKTGMTVQKVETALGFPYRVKTYAVSPEKTWVYNTTYGQKFLVDFTPEGKVISLRFQLMSKRTTMRAM